jgi:predicted permease
VGAVVTDVRNALRHWRRRPGLAFLAALVLALGIGATTAMFSIVNGVLLSTEPWPNADSLVAIYEVHPDQSANPAYTTRWNRMGIGAASWRDLQHSPAFSGIGIWTSDQGVLGDERTDLVTVFYASSSLLPMFVRQPVQGRFFNEGEDAADSGGIILSHRMWQRHFGGQSDVIGRTIQLTPPGASATTKLGNRIVIGVLPEDFRFPRETPDVVVPIGFHAHNLSFDTNRFLSAIGRLAPGTSTSAALEAAEPLIRREEPPARRTARVITLREDRIGVGSLPLWLMLAGAGLLLLAACSNVAGLLLGDGRIRRREIAVRLALGGSRARIMRQLTVEHLVLATAAATAGLLLAYWLIPGLSALAPAGLVGTQAVIMNARVAAWSVAAAVLTTLLAGLIPALTLASTRPGDALRLGGRETTRGGRWRHRAIVVSQFCLALVLLVAAGLFGETFVRLGAQPLGFSPDHAVVASVASNREITRVLTPEEIQAYREQARGLKGGARSRFSRKAQWMPAQALLERLAALPGVTFAAATDVAPFTSSQVASARVRAEGRPTDENQVTQWRRVSDHYFDAMGIAVVRGRGFIDADRVAASEVAVISVELERRVFGGASGVGRTLLMNDSPMDVIGVVANVRQRAYADDESMALYALVWRDSARHLVVSTGGHAQALLPMIRQTVERDDARMFVTAIEPLNDLVARSIVLERARAMLSGAYGLAALLLASVGLYGLTARLVAERRREIGIRIALGAGRRAVQRLVMADTWLIVGLGLIFGVPGSIGMSRLAQGLLYGVAPAAPHTLLLAGVTLTIAAMLSSLVPALRANRVDPATALREE